MRHERNDDEAFFYSVGKLSWATKDLIMEHPTLMYNLLIGMRVQQDLVLGVPLVKHLACQTCP